MTYKKSRQKRMSFVEIKRNKDKNKCVFVSMRDISSSHLVPEEGKTYHFFDDGKIGLSRHYLATVEKVIPMKYVRKKMRDLYRAWVYEAISCYWVYASKSDYAVKCSIKEFDNNPIWFFRTKGGGWFSIDYPNFWMSGKLDIDGEYFKSSLEAHKNVPDALKTLKDSEELRKKMNGEL